jgi:hypothetical protein
MSHRGPVDRRRKSCFFTLLMKTPLNIPSVGLIIILSLSAYSVRADLEVSASVQIHSRVDFEAPLAPHGAWIEVGSYGRCWQPAGVAVGWRPYCAGEWVWTDCGWYWASDEPWGWACYHYGWWVYDTNHGWVWVPQVEWAPAWVSWRVGGGYIGWAPLRPPGLLFARVPGPDHFVFVGAASFGGPVKASALIINNKAIIGKTSVLGGVKRETRSLGGASAQKVMVNHGPGIDMVQKASGKSFTAAPITQVVHRTPGPSPSKRSNVSLASHSSGGAGDSRERGPDQRPDSSGKDNVRSTPGHSADHASDGGSFSGAASRGRQGGGGKGRH